MNENEVIQEDEISLFDLWEKLREGWLWVLGSALAGVIGASLVVAVTPLRYEARIVVQPGRVGGAFVEDPQIVVERLKSPSFLLDVANDLEDQDWVDSLKHGGGLGAVIATVPKATPSIVEIKLRAGSPSSARKTAEFITARLLQRHNRLADSVQKKIHHDIAVASERLNQSESDLSTLSKIIAANGAKGDPLSQLSLVTSFIKQRNELESLNLRQNVHALELSLLPPATLPLRVLEDIFVSEQPVSPRKKLLLGLGLIGGVLAGVVWVFLMDACRRAYQRWQTCKR